MNLLSSLDKKRKLILLIIFLFSLTLRVTLTLHTFNTHGTEYWSDAKLYLRHGLSFTKGDFYGADDSARGYIYVAPITPVIVALSKTVTGNPIIPVLLFNCLISALLIYVLFELGKRLIGATAGYFMALWSVFNFSLIRLNHQIIKEPLLFILIPLIILCLIKIYQNEKVILNTILTSIIFSLLIHSDERYFVYLIFILPFIYFVLAKPFKIKLSILWLVLLIVSMIPWSIINYRQFDQLVILTPRTTAFTSKIWGDNIMDIDFTSEGSLERRAKRSTDRAFEIGEKYGKEPRLYGKYEKYLKAFYHYWKPTYFRLHYIQYGYRGVKWSLVHNMTGLLFYGIFLPFYIIGVVMAFKKRDWLILFLWSLPFIHGLLHTVMVWPLERYRLPMNFLVVLVALWVVNEMVEKWRNVK